MNSSQTVSVITLGISDYFRKNKLSKAVIGLSGGLDSSVSAFLTAKALGNKNLLGILMPDEDVTSSQSIKDAKKVAEKLKIKYKVISISDGITFVEKNLLNSGIKKNPIATANTKARLRMV